MPTFNYKARKLTGEPTTGSIVADSERAALAALDDMGLFPLEVREGGKKGTGRGLKVVGGGGGGGGAGGPAGAPKLADVVRMLRQLADLVRAGVPLVKAISTIEQRGRQSTEQDTIWEREGTGALAVSEMLSEVRREVEAGNSLADALGRFPKAFPAATVGVVRAGEAGGFLDEALERVAGFAEREMALIRRVRAALAYPILLGTLGTASVVFLVAWVVPRFTIMYQDMGSALPLPTRILVGASDLLRDWWFVFVGGLAMLAFFAVRAWNTEAGRQAIDRFTLRVPLLRGVIGRASLARFTSTLGMLLHSGVPILEALEIARGSAGNREFSARLGDTAARVREGQDLSEPLAATRLFPATVISTIAVGQDGGRLGEVLIEIGRRADEDIDHALRIFLSVLEPALIAMMAGVVFFIVLATLLPVFSLNSMMK